jgi:hypothetical protein
MWYKFFSEHLELMMTALLGLLGLIIVRFDLKARRDLQEQELDLKRQQFAAEAEERKRRLDAIDRERVKLTEISGPLGERIAEKLVINHQWASEALEKAKLGPHAATLFGVRSNHFRQEKEFIAEKFTPLLLERCKRLVNDRDKDVFLLIDSGTTLYPFFYHLGRSAIRVHADHENWIDRLSVITNNLPGISRLMEAGRLDPNNRFSRLAIKCEILPGAPLPVYSAVTGKKANEALQRIREDNPDAVFLSLLTGNWIQLPRQPPCPIPLARGEGHPELKRKFIEISDESCVIASLGKIFANRDLAQINAALGLSGERHDPDRKPYLEVTIDHEKLASTKLVTTSRSDGFVLSNLSIIVQDHVSPTAESEDAAREKYVSAEPGQIPHLFFMFDKLPPNWYEELETEFPHGDTRTNEFMSTYFSVPRIPPGRRASAPLGLVTR